MSDSLEQPLRRTAIYNPHLLGREELLRSFIARQEELSRLVTSLRREAEGEPQHHLVVGARGMGKTTLLARLRFAIADDPALARRCLPLVFPEEQYNVGNLADFWLNCVDALADMLEAQGDIGTAAALDGQIARIQELPTVEARRRQALDALCDLATRLDRRLVLLVDNFDMVLDRLADADWALREVLSSESRIQLIGATRAPLESHYRHDRAFYDFFRVHHLTGLTEAETFDVLRRLAAATGATGVTRLLDEEPARIRTVRAVSGGNPRTVALLFSSLERSQGGDVRTDLERLCDLCTPLYKQRIDVLPAQVQQVLDALAMRWDPATAAQVAAATHLSVNTASSQLERLVKDGTVEKLQLPGTRRLGFQIAERFFNVWCLMRASRRVRRRLAWLVEYLRRMYRLDEPARTAPHHPSAWLDEAIAASRESIARTPEDAASWNDLAWNLYLRGEDLKEAVTAAHMAVLLGPSPRVAYTYATVLVASGEWAEARPWARQFLDAYAAALDERWADVLRFFAEAVARGAHRGAHRLLEDAGLADRWEPLLRALEVVARGNQQLEALAPEMREAVRLTLRWIAPDLPGD